MTVSVNAFVYVLPDDGHTAFLPHFHLFPYVTELQFVTRECHFGDNKEQMLFTVHSSFC